MILLNVNMIESNSTISVAAKPNESVKTVVGRIRSMSAVPELNYTLSFQGSMLEPSAPLSFYDISSGNKLTARVQIQEDVTRNCAKKKKLSQGTNLKTVWTASAEQLFSEQQIYSRKCLGSLKF